MKRIPRPEIDPPWLPEGYFLSDTLVFTPKELGLAEPDPTPPPKSTQDEYVWRVSFGRGESTTTESPTVLTRVARTPNRAERRARKRQ